MPAADTAFCWADLSTHESVCRASYALLAERMLTKHGRYLVGAGVPPEALPDTTDRTFANAKPSYAVTILHSGPTQTDAHYIVTQSSSSEGCDGSVELEIADLNRWPDSFGGINDRVTAVQPIDSCVIELFHDANFEGPSIVISSPTSEFREITGNISSLRIHSE